MLKKKKTTASDKLVLVKSVRRTRSHRMKFCVQRGLGALPSTSKRRGKSRRDFALCGSVCINTGIACRFVRFRYMAQKNEGHASSVSLAAFIAWIVASTIFSSFSSRAFSMASIRFLHSLPLFWDG